MTETMRLYCVTGGGSNNGRAIVLAFAAEGAEITIGDIDPALAGHVAAAAQAAGAAAVRVVETDACEPDQPPSCRRGPGRQRPRRRPVNNVGWSQPDYFSRTELAQWDSIIRLNFLGVLNCTHAVLEPMIEQGHGAIVSNSSDASRQGELREVVYGGVKAAVNSFMKTIPRENGRFGIRCNTVCPGGTIPESDEEVGAVSMRANQEAMITPE